jgi:hypothetical protein
MVITLLNCQLQENINHTRDSSAIADGLACSRIAGS